MFSVKQCFHHSKLYHISEIFIIYGFKVLIIFAFRLNSYYSLKIEFGFSNPFFTYWTKFKGRNMQINSFISLISSPFYSFHIFALFYIRILNFFLVQIIHFSLFRLNFSLPNSYIEIILKKSENQEGIYWKKSKMMSYWIFEYLLVHLCCIHEDCNGVHARHCLTTMARLNTCLTWCIIT